MKKIYAVLLSFTLLFSFSVYAYGAELVPIGKTAGIQLYTDGLLVIGTTDVNGRNAARECGIEINDRITAANGIKIRSTEDFAGLVNDSPDGLMLDVVRDDREMQVNAVPVLAEDGVYRLGLWVRDSCAGIGTVTYYDPNSNTFAALGHPVNDADTGEILHAKSGSILSCRIVSVTKSSRGFPGEINAVFGDTELGKISANTTEGIYGSVSETEFFKDSAPMQVARTDEVHTGDAYILSDIMGGHREKYSALIKKITAETGKELVVEITDERLLKNAGGIVQGMSGSPIIQDDLLVGAVTHVFVNSPQRGYGTLAVKMMEVQNKAI